MKGVKQTLVIVFFALAPVRADDDVVFFESKVLPLLQRQQD